LLTIMTLGSLPQPAIASAWDDLWQRHDQQADQALQSGQLERARQLAEEPLRRGEAAYRSGDYEDALASFSASNNPQGDYNRGNTLAQLGRYKEAIAAYDKALATTPDLADAAHNKAELEKLLEQQQQDDPQQADNGTEDQKQDNEQSKSQQADNDTGDQQQEQEQEQEQQGKNDRQQEEQQSEPQQADNKDADQKTDTDTNADDQGDDTQQAQQDNTNAANTEAAALDTADYEQKQADERWLKRIPDDPGGLLRRKFLYQYSQRNAPQQNASQPPW